MFRLIGIVIEMLWRAKFIVLRFLVIIPLLSGCESNPTIQLVYEKNRQHIESGVIGVTKSNVIPNITSNINIRGKGQGARSGALSGLEFCLGLAKGEAPGVLLALICTPFGAVIGATSGALAAEREGTVEEKESNLLQETVLINVQDAVRDLILEEAASYGLKTVPFPPSTRLPSEKQGEYYSISHLPVGTLLEISVTDVSVDGKGWKGIPLRLVVKGNAALKHAKSSELLDNISVISYTRRRNFSAWSENNFSLLKEELTNSYRFIVEQSLDELLLLYHHKKEMTADNWLPKVSAEIIEPIYPRSTIHFNILGAFSKKYARAGSVLGFAHLDEKQTTFKWSPLPSSLQSIKDQLADISYDFRIYEAEYEGEQFLPSKLIYQKRNIQKPQHKVDSSLNLCGRYFWTARARFMLNGHPRVTEWARWSLGVAPWALRRYGERYAPITNYALNSTFFHSFRVGECD